MTAVLSLKGVTKQINGKTLIDQITFEVRAGEIFGFIGPNGAGKTTTIRTITGHMQITKGEVRIHGKSISKEFEQAIAHVGAIIENPELYKFLTGYQNLVLFARMSGIPRKERKQRIDEIVEVVGLESRIHDKVKRYSLGMRQRLGLAQALLHRPSLLILDEPTNGLDPKGISELRSYLKKLAHEEGLAILVSSHLLTEVELMCDRIGIIQKGKIVDVKPVQELVNLESRRIRFTISRPEWSKKKLEVQFPTLDFQQEVDGFSVTASHEQIPAIVQFLVDHDIQVYGVQPQAKSLEELFFETTEM